MTVYRPIQGLAPEAMAALDAYAAAQENFTDWTASLDYFDMMQRWKDGTLWRGPQYAAVLQAREVCLLLDAAPEEFEEYDYSMEGPINEDDISNFSFEEVFGPDADRYTGIA